MEGLGNQVKMIPLSYADQIVEGSFEHALNEMWRSTWTWQCSISATATMRRAGSTTLAGFVSELGREIVSLFRDVLLYASELGLIGKEHFAVDGCKLPSNASKRWSGTHQELEEKRKKLEQVAEGIVQRHREQDANEKNGNGAQRDAKKLALYRRKVEQIKEFLQREAKTRGPTGQEQKSNLTDPESAKMTSSRG